MTNISDMSRRRKQIFKASVSDIKVDWSTNSSQDYGEIGQLAQSICNVGLLQPLMVGINDDGLYLADGFRRYAAIIYANQHLDANIKSVDVRILPKHLDNAIDSKALQLSSNSQKALEYSEALRVVQDLKTAGLTADEIAMRVGRSKSWVYQQFRCIALGEPVLELLYAGSISPAEVLRHAKHGVSGDVVRARIENASKPSTKERNKRKKDIRKRLIRKLEGADGDIRIGENGEIFYELIISLTEDEFNELQRE